MPADAEQPDLKPYAGRWIVLVGDQVTGVGHTAVEALHMARHSRPKERLVARYVDVPDGERLLLSSLLDRLRPLLAQETQPVYLVGGAVRDALLGQTSHDLDFVVPENGVSLAFKVADAFNLPAFALDKERDIGRVVLPDKGINLDFSCFRGPDLEADLRDRDFTINAMAMPATAQTKESVIDPWGGQNDLAMKRVRYVHERALLNDPVRALRAVRMVCSFEFSLHPATATAVIEAGQHLHTCSAERIRDELLKLLQTSVPHRAIRQMAELDLLAAVLPEIAALSEMPQSPPHHEQVLAHTISTLRWLTAIETAVSPDASIDDPALIPVQTALSPYASQLSAHLQRLIDGGVNGHTLLQLGALFHDVGKLKTETMADAGAELAANRLQQLCLSNQAITHVHHIVANHKRPHHLATTNAKLSRRTVYRYFRDHELAGLDVGLLALADHLATHHGIGQPTAWSQLILTVAELFHHYFEQYTQTISPEPLVDGRTLMRDLQLGPGPEIGRLLRLIREAQAAGEIHSYEDALQFARHVRQ